jgi:CubicO group peptidase (beta-lactamase class C family)
MMGKTRAGFAVALLLGFGALTFGAPALAQEATAEPALPKAPVPYTVLHPKPKTTSAKPSLTATTNSAAGKAVVAGAVPTAAALPRETSGARLAAGQAIPQAELEAFVDGVVGDAMAREHVAGVAVAVVQNGQVVLKKGYGFASLAQQQAVDPDRTLFRLGSVSKTFTWIALMKQAEAGRIVLDRPINLYLPERVQVRDQGYAAPVLVRQLMDHSAGFEDRALGQLVEHDYGRVRPLEMYLRQERPRRTHGPGTVSSYSNYGAGLAGEAVAYVSGRPFEKAADDDIFKPLGMSRTTFLEPHEAKAGLPAPMPARLAADLAGGYHWTGQGFQRRGVEFIEQIAPAVGASSTAGDMSRYMLALLGNGQLGGATIFGPKAAQAFRTPLRATPPGVNGWAHGFMKLALPGGYAAYGHDGGTLSFNSNLLVAPDLGLGIFIVTNSDTGQPLTGRFADRLVEHFYAAPQAFPRAGSDAVSANPSAWNGYYLSTRRSYGGLEGFVGRITKGSVITATPDGRLALADLDGIRMFAPDQDSQMEGRFRAAYGPDRLAFAIREGKAVAFQDRYGAALMQRAPLWAHPLVLLALSLMTAFAAAGTLLGLAFRNRDFRQNNVQARASLWQNIQAVLWLTAFVLFGVWIAGAGDLAQVMYGWPGPVLITASACALVSAVLTLATLIVLPAIWQGGRRVDSWSAGRKIFYSLTVLIYAAFSLLLGFMGALSPWSG